MNQIVQQPTVESSVVSIPFIHKAKDAARDNLETGSLDCWTQTTVSVRSRDRVGPARSAWARLLPIGTSGPHGA